MINYKIYIVLAILLFMIISFAINKFSFGVTAMTCCVLFVITGVATVKDVFSGFSNTTTILVASMFVIAGAIGKTSLVDRLRKKMHELNGKSGILMLMFLFILAAALSQIIGSVAVLTIMLLFIQTVDDTGEMCQSRLIFVVMAIIGAWAGRFPVGMGANLPLMGNAFYQGMVPKDKLLGMFDLTKAGLITSIALTIYCLFAWKLIPKHEVDISKAKSTNTGDTVAVSKRDEIIIFTVFLLVIFAFFFTKPLGDALYIIPAIGVLVLIYTKVYSSKEVIQIMTGDVVWMIAGVIAMSSVLDKSGVGKLIGQTVLSILGSHPSKFTILVVFCIVTMIAGSFLSHTGTTAILTPIAASTALAAGMDPRPVVALVNAAVWFCIAFPTGAAVAGVAFAIGRHNPIGVMKFVIPYYIIAAVTLILGVYFFLPM